MSKKYIDADALIRRCRDKAYPITIVERKGFCDVNGLSIGEMGRIVDGMPAEDVEQVKHGYWLKDDNTGDEMARCSACHEVYDCKESPDIFSQIYHYCPNCGCRMDGATKELLKAAAQHANQDTLALAT